SALSRRHGRRRVPRRGGGPAPGEPGRNSRGAFLRRRRAARRNGLRYEGHARRRSRKTRAAPRIDPRRASAVSRGMERIGEYSVVRLVGEGGMGRVYEAEERLSKRRVALKVLRPELVKDEDGRRMFLSEMQILASLEHPNVVRSLASLEHEGQLVLVLEYLEGKTLRAILNERDLSWAEAVDVAAQIASALAAAHGQETPIVHRDLKPENVMVLSDGTVKVMDFGIAKVLEHAHGKSTQSLGTLQYMSPEQIDARAIDGRTDLYALGLLLYEMIAGEPPFQSASPR